MIINIHRKKYRGVFSRYHILVRFIATYSAVLILPVLILGVFFFNRASDQITKNALDTQQHRTDQLSHLLSDEFDKMISMVVRLSQTESMNENVLFWGFRWQNDRYNQIEVIRELEKYKKQSLLIEDILLYYRQYNTIFTSSTRDQLDNFITRKMHIETSRPIENELSLATTHTLLPATVNNLAAGKKYDALLYVIPFNLEKIQTRDMVIVFILSSEKLDAWSQLILGFKPYGINLTDDQGALLLSSGHLAPDMVLAPDQTNHQHLQQFKSEEGQLISLFSSQEDIPGLSLTIGMPIESTQQQLAELSRLAQIIGVFTLISGLMLVIIFSFYNYSPLRQTLSSLKDYFPKAKSPTTLNEYQQINAVVQETIVRNRSLENEINDQSQAFYREILTGLLSSTLQYDRLDKHFDISTSLPGPNYCVIAVDDLKLDTATVQQQLAVYESNFRRSLNSAVIGMHDYHCIAIVMSFSKDDCIRWDITIRDTFAQLYMKEKKIGVSSLRQSINDLGHCMLEAFICLSCLPEHKNDGLLFYKDSLSKDMPLELVSDLNLFHFVQSLRNGNTDQCTLLFNEMTSMIEAAGNTLLTRIRYHPIVSAILTVIHELRAEGINIEVNFLELIQNTNQIQRNIAKVISEICNDVAAHRKEHDEDLFTRMLDYINHHILDYELSLENLAERHDLSASMISKIFKARMGFGFKDYLISKRMEYARHMLCSTDLPVREIAIAVGYTNESHFIKMFKSTVNMTPAHYRKKYRCAG